MEGAEQRTKCGPKGGPPWTGARNTALLIAEGANRYGAGQKRQRFSEARGECGECAAGLEQAMALKLVPAADAEQATELAARVAAMLTGLLRRWS